MSPLARHPSAVARAWALRACLACAVAACAYGADEAAPLAYAWKKDDLFRYEYAKTIAVTQPDEEGKTGERVTSFSAILILEIKAVTPTGATGTLRFDSPRVVLPPIKYFSSQADDPEDLADKSKAVAHALEGAIKQARWGFTWNSDGALRIDARVPAVLHDWLKEPANAAGWRRRQAEQLAKLIEQDLGLRAQSVDRDIFLCLARQPAADATTCVLHPLRSSPTVASQAGGKAELAFRRQAPAATTAVAVPGLITAQPVQAVLQNVATTDGRAVFDAKRRMLDTLREDYTATVIYTCGGDTLRQQVRVQYNLKRLAPPVAPPE